MKGDDFFEGRMLIDGELVESEAGTWLESHSPADLSLLGRVPDASRKDMERAIGAAEAAQPSWAALPMAERVASLHRLADAIEARAEEIARLESLDTGNTYKPMLGDVRNAANQLRFISGMAYEIKGDTVPSTGDGLHMTVRVPYGVVGRIVPFNHPILFAASRIGPATLPGNAIVLKPAEQSPLSASLLGEICAEVFPPGIVSIVTGGRDAGDALVRDRRVKRIAFIGATSTGMAIQRAAAESSVKHITLELGGKNPLIAFEDSDPEHIANAAVAGMNFGWQGQSCGSTSRILVHEKIYDSVAAKIATRVKAIKVGHPMDPDTVMGPINSEAQYKKVLHYIDAGKADGGTLLAGGRVPDGEQFKKGYWIEPTVFGDMDMSMRLAREEVFGPIMSILRFSDEAEAVKIANDIDLGLTASIWTNDMERVLRVTRAVQAGCLWVNGVGRHFRGLPFGGFKNSGIGREGSLNDLLSYTEEKVINFLPLPSK